MKQKTQFLILSFLLLSFSGFTQEKKDVAVEISPNLKSVSEISSFFTLNDIKYYPEIVNDPVKAIDYKGDHKITANIGVYLGDMVYVMGTEGYKEAYKNYGGVMELAKKIGLEKQFPNLIIERYESENISRDSIVSMLDKALDNSERQMSDNDKKEFFDFIIFGNYIEKLYIISELLQKSEKRNLPKEAVANLNRDLLLLMAKQRVPLEDLSKLMIGYSSNIVDHKEIQALIKAYKEMENNADKILKLDPAEIYKAKEIKSIQAKIGKIRSRIVK